MLYARTFGNTTLQVVVFQRGEPSAHQILKSLRELAQCLQDVGDEPPGRSKGAEETEGGGSRCGEAPQGGSGEGCDALEAPPPRLLRWLPELEATPGCRDIHTPPT